MSERAFVDIHERRGLEGLVGVSNGQCAPRTREPVLALELAFCTLKQDCPVAMCHVELEDSSALFARLAVHGPYYARPVRLPSWKERHGPVYDQDEF